jgi:hypothetical protein
MQITKVQLGKGKVHMADSFRLSQDSLKPACNYRTTKDGYREVDAEVDCERCAQTLWQMQARESAKKAAEAKLAREEEAKATDRAFTETHKAESRDAAELDAAFGPEPVTLSVVNTGRVGIRVHKKGCRDVAREAKQAKSHGGLDWEITARDFRDVVLDVYPPEDFSYDADSEWEAFSGDIECAPCVHFNEPVKPAANKREESADVTKIVGKGANRPAAAARTKKHAQRTPLPPKPGKVEDAQEVIAEAKATRTQAKTAKTSERPSEGASRAQIEGSLDPKSGPKALAFVDRANQSGWDTLVEGNGTVVSVTATRGEESVEIRWDAGVYQTWATYVCGDRSIKLRNASHALKQMALSPAEADASNSKVATNKALRGPRRERGEEETPMTRKPLPFALDASEGDIRRAVMGRRIVWRNRITKTAESGRVPKYADSEHAMLARIVVKDHPTNGERVLTWPAVGEGFRSCRLSDILAVQ